VRGEEVMGEEVMGQGTAFLFPLPLGERVRVRGFFFGRGGSSSLPLMGEG
jgi:hypothetical protein